MHHYHGTPTYVSWSSMKERCNNTNHIHYKNYGGRGITVCERWDLFVNFLEDMGERPEGTTLDRYPDKDGNYEPGNCRWATWQEQNKNRRPPVAGKNIRRVLLPNGEIVSLAAASRYYGKKPNAVLERLKRGWSLEDALLKPKSAQGGWYD